MHIILVVLHKLLQRIIRRNSNRRNFFNNFALDKSVPRGCLENLKKLNSYGSPLNSMKILPFLQSIIAPQVLRKGLPKIIGQKLSCTEPSTRNSVGYFTFPQRTSTSLTIPTGEIVCLFTR